MQYFTRRQQSVSKVSAVAIVTDAGDRTVKQLGCACLVEMNVVADSKRIDDSCVR